MTTWFNLAAIAVGGALGSVCRYLITVAAAAIPGGSSMLGTTLANVIGCAAIGALGEYSLVDDALSERAKLAIRVGYLGGLTTFSTFAAESTAMAGTDRWGAAMLYVAANLVLGWTVLLGTAALVRGWMT
jgi:CrcB protein